MYLCKEDLPVSSTSVMQPRGLLLRESHTARFPSEKYQAHIEGNSDGMVPFTMYRNCRLFILLCVVKSHGIKTYE